MSAEIANAHWSAAIETFVGDLGGEFRRFGTIDAFLGGVPLPFANGCLVLGSGDPADLSAAIAWVGGANVPYLVRLDERCLPEFTGTLADHGLVRDPEPMPGMVLQPVKRPPVPPSGVTVEAVDERSYEDFVEVLIATGLPEAWATTTFPRRLIGTRHSVYLLGRLNGRPVGTSLALRTGETGGIYAVGTVEAARKRGVGTAVTWAAVEVIRAWGCQAAVLQSSQMGHPVYRSMGFVDVVDYARFGPPTASRSTSTPATA